jgi:hypothetical protein
MLEPNVKTRRRPRVATLTTSRSSQGSSAVVSPPPSPLPATHETLETRSFQPPFRVMISRQGWISSPLIRASPRGVPAANHQRANPVGLKLASRHLHRCRLRRLPVRSRPRRQREPETSSSAARSTEHLPRSAGAASPTRNQRSRPGSALPAEPTRVANDPRRALDAPEHHESPPVLDSRRSGSRRCRRLRASPERRMAPASSSEEPGAGS